MNWNLKDTMTIVGLVIFSILVYLYLHNQQREIDDNLGVTTGRILRYLPSGKGGKQVEYFYLERYTEYAEIPSEDSFKKKISLTKEYVIEYSIKNPSNSRIIIDSVKYAKGVD